MGQNAGLLGLLVIQIEGVEHRSRRTVNEHRKSLPSFASGCAEYREDSITLGCDHEVFLVSSDTFSSEML